MNHFLCLTVTILIAACLGAAVGHAADELKPDSTITIECPDLPQTFKEMKTGQHIVPTLTARLPKDYTADKKFPLFVFLEGGDGGDGHCYVREYIGDHGYIAVSMPLFKKSMAPPTTPPAFPPDLLSNLPPKASAFLMGMAHNPGIINSDDAVVLASSWTEMLQKLAQKAPNIDPSRSVIAGFSNGAHAIGAVLASRGPFLRQNFHYFAMVEGGTDAQLDGGPWLTPDLADSHILIMYSDSAGDPIRDMVLVIEKRLTDLAAERRLDVTLQLMPGANHSFHKQYYSKLTDWCGATQPAITKP